MNELENPGASVRRRLGMSELTRRRASAVLLGALASLAGCASRGGLGSGGKTAQLRPGMTQAEVRALLGSPAQVQTVGAQQVWRYSLHHYYVGWMPHELVFGGAPARLLAWHTDEAAQQRQREATLRIIESSAAAQAAQRAQREPTRAGAPSASRSCGTYREDRIACGLANAGQPIP
jgi:outer membrane protein assembly factor BamE (lipoprotein component of BamABCDE complex)